MKWAIKLLLHKNPISITWFSFKACGVMTETQVFTLMEKVYLTVKEGRTNTSVENSGIDNIFL